MTYIGTLITKSGREYPEEFLTLEACWDNYVKIATGPNKTFIGYKINGKFVVIDGTCKVVEDAPPNDTRSTIDPSRQLVPC